MAMPPTIMKTIITTAMTTTRRVFGCPDEFVAWLTTVFDGIAEFIVEVGTEGFDVDGRDVDAKAVLNNSSKETELVAVAE